MSSMEPISVSALSSSSCQGDETCYVNDFLNMNLADDNDGGNDNNRIAKNIPLGDSSGCETQRHDNVVSSSESSKKESIKSLPSNCNTDAADDCDDEDDDDDDENMNPYLKKTITQETKLMEYNSTSLPYPPGGTSEGSDDNEITDYGYNDDEDIGGSEERHHFKRRNSCLINKEETLLSALLGNDPLLLGNDELTSIPLEGPPRLSDKDLKHEQQRKASLVHSMYNA